MRRHFQFGGLAEDDEDFQGAGVLNALSEMFGGGYTTAEAQEQARGILDEYRSSMANRQEPAALQNMRDSSEQVRKALRDARERLVAQRYNPGEALLAVSAAFSQPTRTGAFGETIGNVAGALQEHVGRRGEFERGREKSLLDIDLAMSGVDESALKAEFELEKLDQQMRGRMAQEALKTLGRGVRGQGSSSSAQRDAKIRDVSMQLARMTDMDPRSIYDKAMNIVDGHERMEVVPQLGVVRGVNEVSGEAWEVPLRAGPSGGGMSGSDSGRQQVGTPSSTQDLDRIIRSGLENREYSLWDLTGDATGPWSSIRALYGRLGPIIGFRGAPDTMAARQSLRMRGRDIARSMVDNPRMPVRLIEMAIEDASMDPQAADSPRGMQDRMVALDRELFQWYENALRDSQAVGELPEETRSAQLSNARAIASLLRDLNVPEQRRQRRGSIAPVEGLPQEIQDLWNYMSEDAKQWAIEIYGGEAP